MKPSNGEEDAIVDFVDVILREGAVVQADLVLSVADVPLVGIKLSAALAGMEAMTDYGMFEEWDEQIRGGGDGDSDGAKRAIE
ncbi:gas vesicle protein [Haladaptatus sp. DJG-WS-42]|uniref:gas vesicle protein GvpM n=1 Tax=Haladaptatus sp. DJG-WS-42 TaxID=3120516 RepID=UPI0030D4F44B